MKYIVTHNSPDWDAIGSVWLIKRYLNGWEHASVLFVPAGQRVQNSKFKIPQDHDGLQVTNDAIEKVGDDEYMHVDTGLGPLDHHQTNDRSVCGTSRCWEYVQKIGGDRWPNLNLDQPMPESKSDNKFQYSLEHQEALDRIVKVITEIDHFREVYWDNPTADYQEFSLIGLLDGLKLFKQDQDSVYMDFGLTCLDALVHQFENRIWAEKEIKEKGIQFETRWGKAMGFETMNDSVLKLAQKMGYNIVVRKDPRKGYVRIKALPPRLLVGEKEIDLTLAYEKLKKIDPEATWYLHISKKMLLNGTPKNPSMIPTKLTLTELIGVLEGL